MTEPTHEAGNVARIGFPDEPEAPGTPHRGLHGLAVAGMAVSALVGCVSVIALATVSWPEDTSRYVIGTLVLSALGFLIFASTAVFSAARETYAGPSPDEDEGTDN